MNTTRKPITVESLTAAMREAVAERGEDWVYPDYWRDPFGGCQYFRDGEPACLFGLALHKLGYAAEDVQEGVSVGNFLPLTADELIGAAEDAQMYQDSGSSWGQALAKYESKLRQYRLLPDGVITDPTEGGAE